MEVAATHTKMNPILSSRPIIIFLVNRIAYSIAYERLNDFDTKLRTLYNPLFQLPRSHDLTFRHNFFHFKQK